MATNHSSGSLEKVSQQTQANGIIKGAATRILYDRKHLSQEESGKRMSLALSRGNEAIDAAYWIAGFLHGSGLILIHDPSLWNVIDQWVEDVPQVVFKDILPVLRRTFSRFPRSEREQMLQLARKGQIKINTTKTTEVEALDWDESKAERILPGLRLLLGME